MDLAAQFNTAVAAQEAGRLAEAEQGFTAILAVADHLPTLHNLGVICDATERIDEAGRFYRRAAELAPTEARRQFALAVHLRIVRQFAEAEAAYRRTLVLDPDYPSAAFDLGCVLLAMGRFAEGWSLYENRSARRRMAERALPFPEWRGEPLAGRRLLVWREQGFGDQIMMARFLPRLVAAEVTYAGPEPLRRLFGQLPVRFVAADPDRIAGAGYDYWVLPASLPERLGMTAESLSAAPYLAGRAAPAAGCIGVTWRGAAGNVNDRFRSLPAEVAQRLLDLPGAMSLDPVDTGAADLQATADIIAGLDLVITADTAVAHLAGAMGRPVWVLLARYALDWQWPRTPSTPWYPSARLFIQSIPGDWHSVVAEVAQEVRRLDI